MNQTVKDLLHNEIYCFTGASSDACSAINNGYTGFRYALDQIAEHFAQVDYLESVLTASSSDGYYDIIDSKLAIIASNLTVLDSKIAMAEQKEQKQALDISTSHSTPTLNTCADCDAVKFTFNSETVQGGCGNGTISCDYHMVPLDALNRNMWDIRSCAVDNELKSFGLYNGFVEQMHGTEFYVTVSLKKVVVNRPWFDVNLFKDKDKYKMVCY